jgi:hypothetical protein
MPAAPQHQSLLSPLLAGCVQVRACPGMPRHAQEIHMRTSTTVCRHMEQNQSSGDLDPELGQPCGTAASSHPLLTCNLPHHCREDSTYTHGCIKQRKSLILTSLRARGLLGVLQVFHHLLVEIKLLLEDFPHCNQEIKAARLCTFVREAFPSFLCSGGWEGNSTEGNASVRSLPWAHWGGATTLAVLDKLLARLQALLACKPVISLGACNSTETHAPW